MHPPRTQVTVREVAVAGYGREVQRALCEQHATRRWGTPARGTRTQAALGA